MITRADALQLLTLITACHHRTAPRIDDEQATIATADTWAEIFNTHNLDQADLLAAVKRRAAFDAAAPEPAEIIAAARKIRQERDANQGPTPAYEALCESKAADADELAELRRRRTTAAITDRPVAALVASIADRKQAD